MNQRGKRCGLQAAESVGTIASKGGATNWFGEKVGVVMLALYCSNDYQSGVDVVPGEVPTAVDVSHARGNRRILSYQTGSTTIRKGCRSQGTQ